MSDSKEFVKRLNKMTAQNVRLGRQAFLACSKSSRGSNNLNERLQEFHRQIEERDGAIRQKHLGEYITLMAQYREIPDSAIPYVFAEFQRGLRNVEIHTNIPYGTPEEKRKYMAKIHHCLDDTLPR